VYLGLKSNPLPGASNLNVNRNCFYGSSSDEESDVEANHKSYDVKEPQEYRHDDNVHPKNIFTQYPGRSSKVFEVGL
jgi:hypothetical protein